MSNSKKSVGLKWPHKAQFVKVLQPVLEKAVAKHNAAMTYGYCPHCGSQKLTLAGKPPNGGDRNLQRFECKGCSRMTRHPLARKPEPKVKIKTVMDLPNRFVFLVTSAQNATPIHPAFWENLLAYREFRKARLSVVPLRYRNPTSIWSTNQTNDEWWTKTLHPYLFAGRKLLGPGIMLMGDVKTQVASPNPLGGYDSLSGPNSAIFGHPQIALKSVATPQNRTPKIITTTGACTIKNYNSGGAGIRGDFHHSFGATVVEVDGDWFTLRQIVAKEDGSFIDREFAVADGKVTKAPPAEGVTMGDTHEWFKDPDVIKGTFGKGGLVPTLRPKRLFWHDLLDGFTVDHHHQGNPFIALAKRLGDMFDVRKEVTDAVRFVLSSTPPGVESVIIASNHTDHLSRWIRESDWRSLDPDNMVFYLETALAMAAGTKMKTQATSTPDPFEYWFDRIWEEHATKGSFRCLGRDESYSVQGVEYTFHGDKGANGAKGSRAAYSRIGTKTNIGHAHSPGITEGCYQVGTNSYLRLEYNAGLSGWMHTDAVQYANGKRSLIFFSGKRWRL
jgi:hypothetical protein